jgi:4-diphosphocytidyl-2-C-methyl-D-erythritol kinase
VSSPIVEAAPAKINLALHVTGRRADGYHELESLVVFADVGDELIAVPAERDSLVLEGPFAGSLAGSGDNLVTRALKTFRQRWPEAVPESFAFTLRKNLPVAAGLGGGSADAAALLRFMLARAGHPIPLAELSALAAGLGADIPVCLLSRPSEVRGVGEIIHPLRAFPSLHAVLVNPLVPVPTADVFRALEKRDNPPLPALPEPLTRPAQLAIWLEGTRNDLEPPAFALVPRIGEIARRIGRTEGCLLARMSGSGGTVFGLYGSGALAHQAAHDLRSDWPAYWVAAAPLVEP